MYLQSITSEKPSTLCKTVILSTSFSFGRLWAESSNCISCPDWNKTKAIVVKEHRQCPWDRKKVLCALGFFVPIARAITGGFEVKWPLTMTLFPVKSLWVCHWRYCIVTREFWPTTAVIILDLQRTDIFVALTRRTGDWYEHNPRLPSQETKTEFVDVTHLKISVTSGESSLPMT